MTAADSTQLERGDIEHALSRQVAAQLLGIHVNSLDRMVNRGELRVARYCNRTFVPASEVRRLLGQT
jgi:predicted site-specific integrase-resolvase